MLDALVTAPSLMSGVDARWDPRRKITWLLVSGSALFRGALGAALEDFERVEVSGGVPSGGVLFVEPRSEELHAWAATEGKLALYRFDGDRFVVIGDAPIAPTDGKLAVDPKRGVIVLVETKTGQLHQREADGTWTTPASLALADPSPFGRAIVAVWDEPREAIVIVSLANHKAPAAWQWNGSLTEIASSITPVGQVNTHSAIGFAHPTTKRAVVAAYGVGFIAVGAETCERLEPTITLPPTGRVGVSVDPGGAHFWGAQVPGRAEPARITWNGQLGDPDDEGSSVWAIHESPIATWRGTLDCRSHVTFRDGHIAREVEGGGEWTTVAEASDFRRASATVIWDEEEGDRLLIVSGLKKSPKPSFSKPLIAARETWEWRPSTGFTELSTKGKPVGRANGLGVRIPGRAWLVVGGTDTKTLHSTDPVLVTEELEGKTWTAFDTKLDDGGALPVLRRVVADAASGQVFGIAAEGASFVLYPYVSGGVWKKGATLSLGGAFEGAEVQGLLVDYDARTRRLVARGTPSGPRGEAGIFAASIAEYLDALPARAGSAPATAKASTKPAKPTTSTRTPADAGTASAPAAPPAGSSRFLWFREDGVGKFWFGELEGSTWTATWGKRGATAQKKTYELASADKARADISKKVQEKLDKGYVDSPVGAAIAQVAQKTAHPIHARKPKGKAIDRYRGTSDATRPCSSCAKPMTRIALFSADPERLPLGAYAGVAVYLCEDGAAECKSWEPDSGANAVVLLDERALAAVPEGGADAQPLSFERVVELDWKIEQLEEPDPGGSKLGGYPTWLHEPSVPSCDACAAPMQFVGQLDAADVGANFGDSGVGYIFVCAIHGAGKFVSQG